MGGYFLGNFRKTLVFALCLSIANTAYSPFVLTAGAAEETDGDYDEDIVYAYIETVKKRRTAQAGDLIALNEEVRYVDGGAVYETETDETETTCETSETEVSTTPYVLDVGYLQYMRGRQFGGQDVRKTLIMTDLGIFEATGYCACPICCDIWSSSINGNRTAIGIGTYENITVAVDPTVIPYGTKLYIEGYGIRVASDCGGDIKGNRIDIYFYTHEDAAKVGRKLLKVMAIDNG